MMQILIHTVYEQSTSRVQIFNNNLSSFLIMVLWWGVTLNMITMYKSFLLSALVHPPNLEPEDLKQLIKGGYRVVGNVYYKDIVVALLNVNDSLYKQALRQASYGDGPCATFELTFNGKVAMLDEISEIQYELRETCPQYDKNMIKDFRITRKAVRSSGHGWALQKGAPYKQAFDYYISIILSAGLFLKWTKDETAQGEALLFKRSREVIIQGVQVLSFARFTPILIVYCIGICLATLCFLIELLFSYLKMLYLRNCNIEK